MADKWHSHGMWKFHILFGISMEVPWNFQRRSGAVCCLVDSEYRVHSVTSCSDAPARSTIMVVQPPVANLVDNLFPCLW